MDGVARFVDALGQTFVRAGFEVNLVVPLIRRLPRFDHSKRPFNFIFLPTIPAKIKDYYICLPNRKVKRAVKNSDLIIINSLAFATAYVLFFNHFYNKPIIEFVHTDEREVMHYAGNVPDALLSKVFQLLKFLTSQINFFAVATNKFKKRTIDYGVNPKKIFRVPFGYTPKPVNLKHLKAYQDKHQINSDVPIILYLGRLSDEKNIPRLVEVMGQLSLETDVQCVIAGSGYKLNWIKKWIRKHNYEITLLGRVPEGELHLTYKMADILFSPSFHESLCFTTIEAMSYSTIPAVNGNYHEEQLNDSNCLYLDDVTDVERMKEELLTLINDTNRLEQMKTNAYKASEQFSWAKFDLIWLKKVNQILNQTEE